MVTFIDALYFTHQLDSVHFIFQFSKNVNLFLKNTKHNK